MGVSIFEILSKESSPWALYSWPDRLLIEKILSGTRPNTNCLAEIYGTQELKNIIAIINNCWTENIEKRPNAKEVIMF